MQTNSRYIIVLLIFTFITSLTSYTFAQTEEDKFVVVLDAGHGGSDPGKHAKKTGLKEKDIALKIVLKIGKELEKNPAFKVIYTRKTDVFVELHERANIANRADADLFVSIHCNAHRSQAFGTETFVLGEKNTGRNFEVAKRENQVIFLEDNYEENYEGFDPNSPESTIAIGIEQEIYVEQSIVFARKVEDNFISKSKRKSRGLKQASLLVIRNTYMPSVLVETGFITNTREGAYLNSSKGQTSIANSIKEAILEYKKELDLNIGSNIVDEQSNGKSETEIKPWIVDGIVFKIQIAASTRDLEPKPSNFSGLTDLSRIHSDGIYRYFHGNTSDYNKAKKLLETAKSKGFPDAFIVSYKDGNKIDLSEALKSASN